MKIETPALNNTSKILVCGMPRSMTTWIFNVVVELLAETPKTLWIEPASAEEKRFVNEDGIIIAKCHHYSDLLANAASLILYSYRDIRTAAVSYRRRFGSSCTMAQLDAWVAAGKQWLSCAHLVSQYEAEIADPIATIAQLRVLLVEHGFALSNLTDVEIAEKVEERFTKSTQETHIHYDVATMILPQHRTYSPELDKLSTEERALYDRVTDEQSAWLRDFGYLSADAYGQDIEYRLAGLFLTKFFKNAAVVDVGVERGSFTRLALDAGAEQVIGFEPLPRHVAWLTELFSDDARVSIHPLAISNHSGRAILHIATDLSGKELDYHHSLSDLGDSATVIRSQKTLEVDTVTLDSLVLSGKLPKQIDFLKIDTDGHDLAVLEGLGDLRPGVIMAEYWDSLSETSGESTYHLADLITWANSHGYPKVVVIRRNDRLELLEQDAGYSIPGDWGNVFMIHADLPYSTVSADICSYAKIAHQSMQRYLYGLTKDVEEKESEIRRLDNALQEKENALVRLTQSLVEKEAVIQELSAALETCRSNVLNLDKGNI
jgi:FkbM family methyltransferase